MEDHQYITCVLACKSHDSLQKAAQAARQKSDLNNTFVRTEISYPGGHEERTISMHRLGDYFDSIEVITDEPQYLKIVFHPQGKARRFWKDLMVEIVHSVRDTADASIEAIKPSN